MTDQAHDVHGTTSSTGKTQWNAVVTTTEYRRLLEVRKTIQSLREKPRPALLAELLPWPALSARVSQRYCQYIDDQLAHYRAKPDLAVWVDEVMPMLTAAARHVRAQQAFLDNALQACDIHEDQVNADLRRKLLTLSASIQKAWTEACVLNLKVSDSYSHWYAFYEEKPGRSPRDLSGV